MNLKKTTIISVCFFMNTSWSAPIADVITNPQASADNTVFNFSYSVTSPQKYYRVYLDVEHQTTGGFPQGGLYANYLIENDVLYKYVGPGWSWSKVKSLGSTTGTNNSWVVPRADVLANANLAGTVDYLYQVESPLGISSYTKLTLTYPGGSEQETGQKIAVPSYFYPCTGTTNCYWDQLHQGVPTVGIAIINPSSGPGTSKSNAYTQQTNRTQNTGIITLGYVYTDYGNRSATQVKADIDKYYQWYKVDGIFFDEGYSSNCSKTGYYLDLTKYVKSKGGKGVSIVNFGTTTPECYINTTDILVTFESNYSSYIKWKASGWENKYPASRFWHLVYNTPESSLANALSLSKNRNAGWLYITPDNLPNPWDTLPPANYWAAELNGVK